MLFYLFASQIHTCALLQACIASASLGSSYTETLLINHDVVKDGHAIAAYITAFNRWILNALHCQWTAMAATNNVLLETVGTDNATLLLADLIMAMSLANTAAAVTVAVMDVSTSTQRIVLTVTCHSAVSTVASCSRSMTTSYCCCGKDTNALLCTSGPPKTSICLELASEHDVLWLRDACTVASGARLCHNCATQQRTSASTETCTRRLPILTYATTGVLVSSQCRCFMADPVSSTDSHSTYCFSSERGIFVSERRG